MDSMDLSGQPITLFAKRVKCANCKKGPFVTEPASEICPYCRVMGKLERVLDQGNIG